MSCTIGAQRAPPRAARGGARRAAAAWRLHWPRTAHGVGAIFASRRAPRARLSPRAASRPALALRPPPRQVGPLLPRPERPAPRLARPGGACAHPARLAWPRPRTRLLGAPRLLRHVRRRGLDQQILSCHAPRARAREWLKRPAPTRSHKPARPAAHPPRAHSTTPAPGSAAARARGADVCTQMHACRGAPWRSKRRAARDSSTCTRSRAGLVTDLHPARARVGAVGGGVWGTGGEESTVACPLSTRGGTRLVRLVRGCGGGGRGRERRRPRHVVIRIEGIRHSHHLRAAPAPAAAPAPRVPCRLRRLAPLAAPPPPPAALRAQRHSRILGAGGTRRVRLVRGEGRGVSD